MMLLDYLKVRFIKARIVAYLNGECSPAVRRFIARQIDENPRCYQVYRQARATQQTLERELPRFGQPQPAQLDAIWQNVQSELARPVAPQPAPRLSLRPTMGYGAAALLVVVLLMLPLTLNTGAMTVPLPQQHPRPHTVIATTMPAIAQPQTPPTAVVLARVEQAVTPADESTGLHNTPAPRTPELP